MLTHPLPLRDQGSWAPQLLAPATLLASRAPSVSWHAAAGFSVPALTAHQVVTEALDVQGDESLIVNGAAGVTGALIVSLAALRGARVIATASPRNHGRLRRLGATHLIDYHDDRWPERVRELTGGNRVACAANAVRDGAVQGDLRGARPGAAWRRSPPIHRTSAASGRSRCSVQAEAQARFALACADATVSIA